MVTTQEYLINAGYNVEAAPVDDWRQFDEANPVPRYFDFDWFSSRHPDLYNKFALSSEGLMDELEKMIDLSGLIVADIGAGTGRSTYRLAQKAKQVFAVDPFSSVLEFSRRRIEDAGIKNVTYYVTRGDQIPLPDSSVDASISSWAFMDFAEAYRITRPGGCLIFMGSAPGCLCGKLTATLESEYPHLIDAVAPAAVFDPSYPTQDFEIEGCTWNDVPLLAPRQARDFTYAADYGDVAEAAAILGRLYGPKARTYIEERSQSTMSWRMRIEVGRIAK